MKYIVGVCLTGLFITFSVFSQEKNTSYKVAEGETVAQIAQKYKVTPFDIYQLNPDAQSGLKPNSVLLIPKSSGKKVAKTSLQVRTHEVAPKETLFGIEKKYNVSDEDLKKANPTLETTGLQIGQIIVIPSSAKVNTPISKKENVVYHEVLPKETKYSIAKQYGITIEELEKKNPEIIANLPIGYNLIIKGNAPKAKANPVVIEPKKVNTVASTTTKKIEYSTYTVKPKETLYSLSKMTGLSQEELVAINPSLATGVQEGMMLKVPANSVVSAPITPVILTSKKTTTQLYKKNNSDRKKLALLLPFNISRIESDTLNSTVERLKKDKFLNMTLDFYSGALMAIDSAKQIGLSVDVSIFDSQETKLSSNVERIIQDNNLENSDAIVGPFYQNNVEKVAELLKNNNVAVISPLSKDLGKSYDNVFQTVTPLSTVKNAMFSYMRDKGGNVIAVVDKKRESARQYIQQNHPDVSFAALTEKGGLIVENLKSLFVKDKTNFVILETANTGMIKTTMAAMMSVMATYKVQLVILEPNETLDTDEINFVNLTKLKLMYPSATRDNESPEALIFEKEYKRKNKINPTAFATRGFDVTFDTMMRLSQGKSYQESAESTITEQVDNKFEFYKKEEGGYLNKGVYILYYDTDLTIKEAK